MGVQSEYLNNLAVAVAGMIANMVPATLISRTVEDAAGIGFGLPVAQGVNDKGVTATLGSPIAIVGITVRERSVSAEADKFGQYEEARLMTKGVIWVVADDAVAAGDPVHVNGDGTFTNTGGTELPNARWDTSADADGLAQIRLG
jgi:hypothetical protein